MDQRWFGDNTYCSVALGVSLRLCSFAEGFPVWQSKRHPSSCKAWRGGDQDPGSAGATPTAERRVLLSTSLQGELGKHQSSEFNLPSPEVGAISRLPRPVPRVGLVKEPPSQIQTPKDFSRPVRRACKAKTGEALGPLEQEVQGHL